jgi:hypothetical protein
MYRQLLIAVTIFLVSLVGSISAVRLAMSQTSQPGPVSSNPSLKAERFQAGPTWAGRGSYGLDEASLEAFSDFPILWLGPNAFGYNLQVIDRIRVDPIPGFPDKRDSVSFVYGACSPAEGHHQCVAPITVHVEPACLITPDLIADNVKAEQGTEVVRGATVQRFRDGHVRLWTGDISVYINSPGEFNRAGELISQLRGIGQTSAITTQSRLPAPDLAKCS